MTVCGELFSDASGVTPLFWGRNECVRPMKIMITLRKEKTVMPFGPKVPCKHPGCPELVEPGKKYCDKHRSLHPEETRSASGRGYGRAWQKASKQFLAANLLCVRCMAEGRYRKATVVDHIIPHRGDEKLFWDRENWQPLCKRCHDKKTWTEDKNPEYRYK